MTDLLSLPVVDTMATVIGWGVEYIAPDEYKKRYSEILDDCERRMRELEDDVLDALGEPDNDCTVLSTCEREVMQRYPSEYRKKWGKIWREWKVTIPSSDEFWRRWGIEVRGMCYRVKYRNSTFSEMQPTLNYKDAFSARPLPRHKMRHRLSSSLRSLPQARIHHPSLRPARYLAAKAYSKGLITQGQMTQALSANGLTPMKLASDFLIAIQNRIKRDEKAFDKFVAILKSEPAYEHLVTLVGAT